MKPLESPIDLLTWAGASALALVLTEILKRLFGKESRLQPALASVFLGMALLFAYSWCKGHRSPGELADVLVLGLFAGANAVGLWELQKLSPKRLFASRTPGGPDVAPGYAAAAGRDDS